MITERATSNVYSNLALPTTDWAGRTRRAPGARSRASKKGGARFGMSLALSLVAMTMKDLR